MTAIILVARFAVSLGCPMASSPWRAHRGVLSMRASSPCSRSPGCPMASSPCRAHRGVLSMRASSPCSRSPGCPMASSPWRAHRGVLSMRASSPCSRSPGCPMASSPWRAHRGVLSMRASSPCSRSPGCPMASSPWRAHRGVVSMRAGSQGALGGEDAGDARVEACRLRESAGHRLEGCLRDVVEVLPVVHVDVQRDLRVEGEGAEEVLEQIEVEVRHARAPERHVEDEIGSTRDVHRRMEERLVHGQERRTVAHDASAIAESLPEGLAQADADVLHGVMEIDLEIAVGLDGEVHEAMLRPRLQHVIEERDPRHDLGGAGAVEPQVERDLRLLGLPLHAPLAPSAARCCRHGFSSVASMRIAAAVPWPSSPSTRASAARCGPASRSPAGAYSMTLRRFTKSSVPRAEAKRAVPPVGST